MKDNFNDWLNKSNPGMGIGRLDDWKIHGSIVVFLHTATGMLLRLQWVIPHEVYDEENDETKVCFLYYTSPEDPEDYYNREEPKHDPLLKLINWIADNDEIDEKTVIWKAIDGSKNDKIIKKREFCSMEGHNWRNAFKPRGQYIFAVIDAEHPKEGIQIAQETIAVGSGIKKLVKHEIDSNDLELGNPAITPYAMKFEYDKKAKTPNDYYSIYRNNKAEVTEEIKELLASDPIPIQSYLKPGDSNHLRGIVKGHLQIDIDLDQFFGELEEETEEVKETKKTKSVKKETKKTKSVKKETKKTKSVKKETKSDKKPSQEYLHYKDGDTCVVCKGSGFIKKGAKSFECPICDGKGFVKSENPVDCDTCGGKGFFMKKGKKITCPVCEGTGMMEPEEAESKFEPIEVPNTPKKVEEDTCECPNCKKMIPESSESCPECGITFDEDEDNETCECPNCKKMIPESSKNCPECGIGFEDD